MTVTRRRLRHALPVALVACWLAAAAAVQAFELIPAEEGNAGQSLIVQDEVVTLTIVSSSAGFENLLLPAGGLQQAAVSCRDAPIGFTSLVGRFEGRQELLMTMATSEGDVWSTGPPIENDDLVPHARISKVGPNTLRINWEDMRDGGDVDYNDCVVTLTITPRS